MINHIDKTIATWWSEKPLPGNFGDILTPYIINKLSGYTAIYTPPPFIKPTFIGVGSVFGKANELTTFWGSGAMRETDMPNNEATFLAVRGPISRDVVIANGGKCPDIFGDPALLLPQLYQRDTNFRYDIGIVPHYVDTDQVDQWYGSESGIKVINLLNADITKTIDSMLQCRHIISSSLHGIVVAAAYGIPTTWVRFSDKLDGDGTKFRDFFRSIKVKHKCTELIIKDPIYLLSNLPKIKQIKIDLLPLLEAFPIQKGRK